jgi:hypothetical protein
MRGELWQDANGGRRARNRRVFRGPDIAFTTHDKRFSGPSQSHPSMDDLERARASGQPSQVVLG